MEGVNITAVYRYAVRYLEWQFTGRGKETETSGYIGEIWRAAEWSLRFNTHYKNRDELIRVQTLPANESDIYLLPFVIINSSIFDQFSISMPIFKTWFQLATKDLGFEFSSKSYVLNYSVHLWTAIILMAVFSSSVVCLSIIFYRNSFRYTDTADNLKVPKLVYICFFDILSLICFQGSISHRNAAIRSMFYVTTLMAIILYQAYSAVLLSKLTILTSANAFYNLDGILTHGKGYTVCMRQSRILDHYFKEKNNTVYKPEWKGIVDTPLCDEVFKYEHLLCDKKVAMVQEMSVFQGLEKIFISHCNIKILKEAYAPLYLYVLLGKWSPPGFISGFNSVVLKLKQAGVLEKLERKYLLTRKGLTGDNHVTEKSTPITFEHVKGVLLLYCGALVVSLIVFVCECVCNVCEKFMKKKQKFKVETYVNIDCLPVKEACLEESLK